MVIAVVRLTAKVLVYFVGEVSFAGSVLQVIFAFFAMSDRALCNLMYSEGKLDRAWGRNFIRNCPCSAFELLRPCVLGEAEALREG